MHLRNLLSSLAVLVGIVCAANGEPLSPAEDQEPRASAKEEVAVNNAASDEAATNRTTITSSKLTFDYKRSIAIFEGNVVVRDPQIDIDADRLIVQFNKDNTVRSMTAVGNVELCTGDKTGTCRRAVYLAKAGELLLMGDAVLVQSGNRVSGNQITFFVNEDRVKVEPGSVLLMPQKGGRTESPFGSLSPRQNTGPAPRGEEGRGSPGVRKNKPASGGM